jgi:acyl-CoA dehydrogenase
MFISKDKDDVTGCVEHAFELECAVEPVKQKLFAATRKLYQSHIFDEHMLHTGLSQGVITEAEADQLREAAQAVHKVIMVDDFTKEEAAAGGIIKKPAKKTKKKASKDAA